MSRPRTVAVVTPEYRRLAERLQAERRALGYAAHSCRTYYLQACEVLAFLERDRGVRRIEHIDVADVEAYYEWLAVRPSRNGAGALSTGARRMLVRVCRDLFAMLTASGELVVDPSSGAKGSRLGPDERGERVTVSQEEVRRLYVACESARDRALISLAYGCGLRAGEVEALDVGDVRLSEGLVIVERGKGGRRRAVPVGRGVARDLEDYIHGELRWWREHGEGEAGKALLVNERGRRMRDYTFNKVLRGMSRRAGLLDEDGGEKRVTCHVLRHAIATHLLERGMGTELVRQFLGHRWLQTTQIYTHVSQALINELTA